MHLSIVLQWLKLVYRIILNSSVVVNGSGIYIPFENVGRGLPIKYHSMK